MPLDATPKGTSSNAYCTRAEADAFIAEQMIDTSAWTALVGADKDARIILGAKLLDACFEWYGAPRTLTQAMAWPRMAVRNRDRDWFDYDTIPTPLKEANAELALALAKRNRVDEPELLGLGIKELKAGDVSIVIDHRLDLREQVLSLIPAVLRIKMDYLGQIKPGAAGNEDGFLRVVRT